MTVADVSPVVVYVSHVQLAGGSRKDLNRAALAKYFVLAKGVAKKAKQTGGVLPKKKSRRAVA